MKNEQIPSPRGRKVVYTIIERQRDGRKYWLRIGSAFENRDGSVNIYLDAMPTNGQLQIREQRQESRNDGHAPPHDRGGDPPGVVAAE